MYSSAYIWGRILSSLEKDLSVPVVSSYLDDADIVEVTSDHIILSTPSEYRRDMIVSRFSPYIQAAAKNLFSDTFGDSLKISVLLNSEVSSYHSKRPEEEPFMFNEQFTFDRFVVGSSNRFAHAAAISVSNNPSKSYNPLFIYGPSGLGKTHLLYAIAGEIHRTHPEFKIVYIKGDQFTIDLISAIQEGKNQEFRDKYRNADLFLMDDIQFIGGKDSTQEEFFHTFNSLYEANKQIVLTSDRPPEEVQKLDDRLRTRFQGGLTADIQPPDYETRMAIIKNKSYSLGLSFPDDVCSYIAENITSNVRQLEGAVKRIRANHDLTGAEIDIYSVSRALRDLVKDDASAPTPARIISEVCNFYSIDESILRGTKRDKVTAEARQVAMFLIRKMTSLSLPDIGREFGKDHTTVIHAISKINDSIQEESSGIRKNLQELESNINNHL